MDVFYNRVGRTVRPALLKDGALVIPEHELNHLVDDNSTSIEGMAYSDDGRYFVQAARTTSTSPWQNWFIIFDHVTHEWRRINGELFGFSGGQSWVNVGFKKNSYELFIAGNNSTVAVFNVATEAVVVFGSNLGYQTPMQDGGVANFPGTNVSGIVKAMDDTYLLVQVNQSFMFVVSTDPWDMVSVSPSVGSTIRGADYDPVSDRVAIVYGSTLRMFDVSNRLAWVEETGMPALTWTAATQCVWSPDGAFLAIGYGGLGNGNRLDIWDVSTWTKVSTRNYADILEQLVWVTARRLLVKRISMEPEIIDGNVSWISRVTIQPNLNFIWHSGASMCAVMPGGGEIAFTPYHATTLPAPSFLQPNGDSLYEMTDTTNWNPIMGSLPQTGTIQGVVKISRDGRWMAVATNSVSGEKFFVWDLLGRFRYRPYKPADEGGSSSRSRHTAFSRDSQYVALIYANASGDTELHVFNVSDWSVAYTETFQSGVSSRGKPECVAFSDNHLILVCATSASPANNNRVHFIEIGTWGYVTPAIYEDTGLGSGYDTDVSSDGRLLAIGGSGGIWIVDLETWALTKSSSMPAWDDLSSYALRVKFSPDVETLAFLHTSTFSPRLRFMRVSDWTTIGNGPNGIENTTIDFTDDSRYFFCTTTGGLRYVHDMDTMTAVTQPASPDNSGTFMGFARGKGERWQVRAVVRSGGEAVVREVRMIGPTGTVVATETSDPYYGLVRFPETGAVHRFGYTLAAVDPADPENQSLWWTAEIPGDVPLPELVLSPSAESFDWATQLPYKLLTAESLSRDRPGIDTGGVRTERLIGGAEPDDSTSALFKSAGELKIKLKPEDGYNTPDAATPKRISVRASADDPETAVSVKLWQGSTMIAEWVQATWPSTPTTLHFELTEAQRAAVTDWDDISVTVGAG